MKLLAIRSIDHRITAVVVIVCIALGWLAEQELLKAGGMRPVITAGALALLPIFALLSWRRPLIFPFCVYAGLVPFDNLLASGSGDTLTKLLAIASAGVLLFHLVLGRRGIAPPRAVFTWLLLLVWMGATIFWAIDQGHALETYSRYIQLFLLLTIVSMYPVTSLDLRIITYCVIVGGCAASIYGLYSFSQGVGDIESRMFVTSGTSFIDPNHFGAALLMPIALAMMLTLSAPWSKKLFAVIPLVILIAGLYASASRGAFTAVAVMLAFFILFSRYRVQAIVATVVAIVALPPSFVARLQIAAASGGNGRVDIWHSAFAAFKEHWLLGAGIGDFPFAYDNVYLKVHHSIFFSWHMQAHNLLAQTSVELGVLGIVLMLLAWFMQFRDARLLQMHQGFEDIALALQGGVLALFISSLFLDIMWSKYTWLAFILVALARSALISRNQVRRSTREAALLPA